VISQAFERDRTRRRTTASPAVMVAAHSSAFSSFALRGAAPVFPSAQLRQGAA
jgi:hypothetical protein